MPNKENLIPAKKGEIRNPKGRTKGSKNRATVVKYWMNVEEVAKNPITREIELLDQEDLMVLGQIKAARSGSTYAFDSLMKWNYGMPPQGLTGGDGGPIQFENVKGMTTEQLLTLLRSGEQS